MLHHTLEETPLLSENLSFLNVDHFALSPDNAHLLSFSLPIFRLFFSFQLSNDPSRYFGVQYFLIWFNSDHAVFLTQPIQLLFPETPHYVLDSVRSSWIQKRKK